MSEPFLPLLVEPDGLERQLRSERLLVVDLCETAIHIFHHVPGAVHLDYRRLVAGRPPAPGLLPDDAQLSDALAAIGLTPATHVVAYDDQGNANASRLLWTLDVVGHTTYSLLDGGLRAWLTEGHPTKSGLGASKRGAFRVAGRGEAVADATYILDRLGDADVVLLDARTPAEFSGADVRSARGGHIPAAINMDWREAIDSARNLRLKPIGELRTLLQSRGVTPDKEVITYCHTHHRSAHTYLMLKALGYPRIKGYPGSWSEWGNDPRLPVEA